MVPVPLIILGLIFCSAPVSDRTFTVVGRVVDAAGQPVAGANVLVWPVRSARTADYGIAAIDELIEWQTSGPDGIFRYSTHVPTGTHHWRLYVTNGRPEGADLHFNPPDDVQRAFGRSVGRKLNYSRKGVDVGDVPVDLVFAPVQLRLVDALGRAVFTSENDSVTVEIQNARGRRLLESTVSMWAKHPLTSTVRLALPLGSWRIRVRCRGVVGEAPVSLSDAGRTDTIIVQMRPR